MGVELRAVSSEEKKLLKISNGVKVVSIRKGSTIDRTNLMPGFIITKANDTKVETVDELMEIIEKSNEKVMLEGIYEADSREYYYAFKK